MDILSASRCPKAASFGYWVACLKRAMTSHNVCRDPHEAFGDAASLAGWRFSHEALDERSERGWLDGVHRASRIDVFASTHTCLAALRDLPLPGGRLTVINNGTAGMPNFTGTQFGLISRIATSASPHPPLYGMRRDGVHIDAIALTYDVKRFLPRFLARWPDGSPAHTSYLRRIEHGPDHAIAQAANS